MQEQTGLEGVSRAALLSGHSGLWKTCNTVLSNDTDAPGQAFVISEFGWDSAAKPTGVRFDEVTG